jgi:hypothetical protein
MKGTPAAQYTYRAAAQSCRPAAALAVVAVAAERMDLTAAAVV